MSVLVETSLGDMVVDLFCEECPNTARSFLKLCRLKYFNGCLFHEVRADFMAQTGDPTGTGRGGDSVYGLLSGDAARRFMPDEIRAGPSSARPLRHDRVGTVSMASAGPGLNASQFFITTAEGALPHLDGRHTVFGRVEEGLDTLRRINAAHVDEKGRPLRNVRVHHTIVLDDPFPDPPGMPPAEPPSPPAAEAPAYSCGTDREEADAPPAAAAAAAAASSAAAAPAETSPEAAGAARQEAETRSRAEVLEMIGDLPSADARPPDNVLFVCRLNPVTTDDDLRLIFSRFGRVVRCDTVRDWKTRESLGYGFVEFEDARACERAYLKMDGVLVDDRRIHVDFSQSVSRLWGSWKRGGGAVRGGSFDDRGRSHGLGPGGGRGRLAEPPRARLEEMAGRRGAGAGAGGLVFGKHRRDPEPAASRSSDSGSGSDSDSDSDSDSGSDSDSSDGRRRKHKKRKKSKRSKKNKKSKRSKKSKRKDHQHSEKKSKKRKK